MCGISGYVGKTEGNIDKLKILGLYNTTRGSDSCGIALNNQVVKGVGTIANFSNFIEQKVIKTHKEHENYTVLIHTRNASIKSTKEDPECAHPFEIKTKKGKTILVGMHNGVINNETEIAKKYGVKEEKVDSKTLLSILAKAKTDKKMLDVLKDYEGAAALAWYYLDEPNTLYLWKGASKKWSSSTELEEERPLYVYRVKDDNGKFTDEFYFSSIQESLLAIGGDLSFKETDEDKEPSIKSIETNSIIKITPGDKFRITPIKRNQESSTYVSQSSSSSSRYSTTGAEPKPHPFSVRINKKDRVKLGREQMLETFKKYPVARIKNNPILSTNKGVLIDNEPFLHDFHAKKNKVYFRAGRYWQNGHMLGGNIKDDYISRELDIEGYPKGHPSCDETCLHTYYFFQGLLILEGQRHLDEIKRLCKTGILWSDHGKALSLINLHTHIYGFCHNLNDIYGHARASKQTWAEGEYYPMFDYDRVYNFKSGFFVNAEYVTLSADIKQKMFNEYEGKNIEIKKSSIIVVPEGSKLNSLSQRTSSAEISEALSAITDVEEDKIFNHCYDSISSLKVTLKELDKVKENPKYSLLYGVMKGMLSTLQDRMKKLEKNPENEELVENRGPLYS